MGSKSSLIFSMVIVLFTLIIATNGLQCHICGQFNDGVGSITPCLNYTETNAHLHLKECPRKTDKFCVKKQWNKRNLSLPASHSKLFILNRMLKEKIRSIEM
ncbi:CLUMA_CG000873, isoform A [Clunio marinus]|uniref:CLUMA_CG000873, isoform A n=1 Tax=Clunio marinus TaxID=568069 RepID=A0A1J1HG87_9DIPT|nr:CLUMA_CG000873, isoform A [Clunio marinus]